jgi:hypothetical protein
VGASLLAKALCQATWLLMVYISIAAVTADCAGKDQFEYPAGGVCYASVMAMDTSM